jgi:hypothetical protein
MARMLRQVIKWLSLPKLAAGGNQTPTPKAPTTHRTVAQCGWQRGFSPIARRGVLGRG